jgi:hypothetical protein
MEKGRGWGGMIGEERFYYFVQEFFWNIFLCEWIFKKDRRF